MKPKLPPRVAYCWLYYRELSAKDIAREGCTNADKQSWNWDGKCKYIQFYGDKGRGISSVR